MSFPPNDPLNLATHVLARNLAVLRMRSPRAADAIARALPRGDAQMGVGEDGALTLSIGHGDALRQLTSRRTPLQEAKQLVATVDLRKSAAVVVLGFGAGHHVAELARKLSRHGLILVFEPDVPLLRAVMEQLDCTAWLGTSNAFIVTDANQPGAITQATAGLEGMLAAGTVLLAHPPSVQRLKESSPVFQESFANVMKAVRTNVLTTLVHVTTTVRNLLQNADWYCTRTGIEDLRSIATGRAAVVVSAGPSLHRNLDLLAMPGIRDRVVIIAVQTVLKTMLSRGIRPHFVTALDHHEISRRFYEGLSAADVQGVTLVAEPKANPAILEAYPGTIRLVKDKILDDVLGPELARPMGELRPGATVAHLAYYLARHLGCDPVILIGQDLGFTDNLYYAPGAAIHRVWSGELSEFNTLEMLEWQRIARMRRLLRRVPAQGGGEIYTDEQMATYLVQFERDFEEDARRGLTIIDATEGGVSKKNTVQMPLREALDRAAHGTTTAQLAAAFTAAPEPDATRRLQALGARVKRLEGDAAEVGRLSEETAGLVRRMLASHHDTVETNRLIEVVQQNAARVSAIGVAYRLVQFVNQAGQLNRFKADREIAMSADLGPLEKQRLQMERDLKNVSWLKESAEQVGRLLAECRQMLSGGARQTRDREEADESMEQGTPKRVLAFLVADVGHGGLNTARDLLAPLHEGRHALDLVIRLLSKCAGIDGVVVTTANAESLRTQLTEEADVIEMPSDILEAFRAHRRSVGAGRIMARHCWRGGVANLSCYDEEFCPQVAAWMLQERPSDAIVTMGADWCLAEESLVAQIVARWRENPERHQITFSQAPAGKGACVVAAEVVRELAQNPGPNSTIGGLLGYHPVAPQSDPIANPACVQIDPAMRDALVRFIPDSTERASMARRVLAGERVKAAQECLHSPEIVRFVLAPVERRELTTHHVMRVMTALVQAIEDVVISIDARRGDAGLARQLVMLARSCGAPTVHVMLDAEGPMEDAGADVTSLHVGGRLSLPSQEAIRSTLGTLVETGRLPVRWFIPHAPRTEATLHQLEAWYDWWLLATGTAVIEPATGIEPDARIGPIPEPAPVQERKARTVWQVSRCGLIRTSRGIIGDLAREHVLMVLDRLGVAPWEGGRKAEQPQGEGAMR